MAPRNLRAYSRLSRPISNGCASMSCQGKIRISNANCPQFGGIACSSYTIEPSLSISPFGRSSARQASSC